MIIRYLDPEGKVKAVALGIWEVSVWSLAVSRELKGQGCIVSRYLNPQVSQYLDSCALPNSICLPSCPRP